MKAYEKIDFLMKITNTSNIALGRYLNFDASYISRIRSGKRNLPKTSSFMEKISAFFAECMIDDYQKQVVGELAAPGKEWPDHPHKARKLLYLWLNQPEQENTAPIANILSGISSIQSTELPPVYPSFASEMPDWKEIQYFYGNEGKRTAVCLFLTELGQMEHPPRLLLYSNEEFDWMYENPKFAKKWAGLLLAYIRKGGKIKIVHTISRASNEMLVALQKWIPVYMTGAVEPYYYPKLLDRVFRKTLFLAEGHSAILAGSVGTHTDGALNILIRDGRAIKSLENEYWDFLDLCKPLMEIYNVTRRDAFFAELKKFYENPQSTVTVRTTPSFFTMPVSVAESMNRRLDHCWILKRQKTGEKVFRQMMAQGDVLMEVLNLPDEDSLCSEIPFPMCDLFDKPGLFYTPEEFREHLDHMIQMLKENENYYVCLSPVIPSNELIYVKEDATAIVVKSDFPGIAFILKEPRMVAALWDYLNGLGENRAMRQATKEASIRRLEQLLDRLSHRENREK